MPVHYTEASWTAFQNALASARAILSDENATQDEVDQALKALEDARDALEKTPVTPVENRPRNSSRPWSSRRRRLTPRERRPSPSRP